MAVKGKPAPKIDLDLGQREQLEGFAGSQSLAHSLVVRARVILLAAERKSNAAIAKGSRIDSRDGGEVAHAVCRFWY